MSAGAEIAARLLGTVAGLGLAVPVLACAYGVLSWKRMAAYVTGAMTATIGIGYLLFEVVAL